jgi:hypothetical protein
MCVMMPTKDQVGLCAEQMEPGQMPRASELRAIRWRGLEYCTRLPPAVRPGQQKDYLRSGLRALWSVMLAIKLALYRPVSSRVEIAANGLVV